ncbi:MAG: FAD-binding oxidoreductase [Chloroflexi bacterium]|nr:FAD-binding oxidoreductase [Chloroflexota bacterium]
MGVRANVEDQLKSILGEAVTASPLERELYAHDLAAVPSFLSQALIRATPDIVAKPRSTEEVSAVLKYAFDHRLPVTPRAAGSTAFHNSVPAKGGILLDLNGLRGIVEVDAERKTVTVLAATRWKELDDELRYGWGLAVKTYPTSAPSGTVGGWFNMGGFGVGSLRYGPLRDLVAQAEVVLPGGEVRGLSADSDPPLCWLAGAEGTLGVITKLELSLRQTPAAASNHLITFHSAPSLQQAALALAGAKMRPYHLHVADDVYGRMTRAAGFAAPVAEELYSLFLRYEGGADEVDGGASQASALARKHGGTELSLGAAEETWDHRFSEVRIKRAGPSLLGVELLLSLSRLADFMSAAQRIGRSYDVPIHAYGSVVSETHVQLNAFFPADERRSLPYVLSLGITKNLHDVARGLGGRPYGVGLWNTPYLGHAYARQDLSELRRRKGLLDPGGIMNPGKLYAPPAPLAPPLFGLAMDVLSFLGRIGGHRRGKGQGAGGK